MEKPSQVKNPEPDPGEGLTLSKVIQAAKAMRLEPIVALHMTSAVMISMMTTTFMMERACRINIGATQQECDNFFARNFTRENMQFYINLGTEISEKVSSTNVWRNAIEYSLPVVYMLLLGNWSDKYGRKPLLLLPLLGYLIQTGGLLLSVFNEEWSMETLAILTSVPLALTGSSSLFTMAAYSWVGDTSTPQLRTIRIGIISCGFFLGVGMGTTLGGNLYEPLGFKWMFIIGECLEVASFFGILFFVKNTRPPTSTSTSPATELTPALPSPSGKERTSGSETKKKCSIVTDIFDYSNVTQAIRTAFKRREGHNRLYIWILFVTLFLGLLPTPGESSTLYLFVVQKLGWRQKQYGNYGTYMLFIAALGTFVSMGVFNYILKLPDPLIGIFACLSQMAAAFVYGYASESRIWMMYLAPFVDAINGTITIVTRSMGSKLVDAEELGRLNAFFGIADAIVPWVAKTLYSEIYNKTLTDFPGAFFLVSAGFTFPLLFIFGYFYWQVRREKNKELKTDGTAEKGGNSADSEASGSHIPKKERF